MGRYMDIIYRYLPIYIYTYLSIYLYHLLEIPDNIYYPKSRIYIYTHRNMIWVISPLCLLKSHRIPCLAAPAAATAVPTKQEARGCWRVVSIHWYLTIMSHNSSIKYCPILPHCYLYSNHINGYILHIWRFPYMGVPLNHPFKCHFPL